MTKTCLWKNCLYPLIYFTLAQVKYRLQYSHNINKGIYLSRITRYNNKLLCYSIGENKNWFLCYFVTNKPHWSLTHASTALWVLPESNMKNWICCTKTWRSSTQTWESTTSLTQEKSLQRNSLVNSTILKPCSWYVSCSSAGSALICLKQEHLWI